MSEDKRLHWLNTVENATWDIAGALQSHFFTYTLQSHTLRGSDPLWYEIFSSQLTWNLIKKLMLFYCVSTYN